MRKLVVILSLILIGCQTYSGSKLNTLAEKNLQQETVTSEMCADFKAAARASLYGENKAFPIIGRARELKSLSRQLQKMGIVCDKAVKRLNDPDNPMSSFNHGSLLDSFHGAWKIVLKLSE